MDRRQSNGMEAVAVKDRGGEPESALLGMPGQAEGRGPTSSWGENSENGGKAEVLPPIVIIS